MDERFNRRDFLRLVASLPLLTLSGKLRSWNIPLAHSNVNKLKPNILILVFDALSGSNVSLFGYPRQTTPNFSRFAEKSTVYHRHYAGGTFTTPGTASLFTGAYPWSHRAFHLYGTVLKQYRQQNIFYGFPGYRRVTYTHNDLALALLYQFADQIDVLKKTEELTLFYENLFANSLFARDHNAAFLGERALERGQRGESNTYPGSLFLSLVHRIWRTEEKGKIWDKYKKQFPRGVPSTNANPIFYLLEDAINWVQVQLSGSQPFLGYFHFLPPHEPYNTRREYVNIFKDGWKPVEKPAHYFSDGHNQDTMNHKRREYDEFVAYADEEFGRLYDFMEREGLLENTFVIVTSDHGEMFERGILEHITPTLYEPIVRIPLIISAPGQVERVDILNPTSCVDVLPTLLHVTGQAVPEGVEGVVLPPFKDQSLNDERNVFFMDAKTNYRLTPLRNCTVGVVKGRYKLVRYYGYEGFDGVIELYDLFNDPDELIDISSIETSVARDLSNLIHVKLQESDRPYISNE
jgi:arylsulfatase A-like enzyme